MSKNAHHASADPTHSEETKQKTTVNTAAPKLQQIEKLVDQFFKNKLSEKQQKKLLIEIREILFSLVDGMRKTPSYLSQAAQYWAKIPLWQKIIAGLLLTAPPLIIGLVFHVAILLTIFCISLVTYSLSAFFLKDHKKKELSDAENVKQGVGSIVDLFSGLIITAKELCDSLEVQINTLAQENVRHEALSNQFSTQITEFVKNNNLFENTTDLLGEDLNVLVAETGKFTATVEKSEFLGLLVHKLLDSFKMLYNQIIAAQNNVTQCTTEIAVQQQQITALLKQINELSKALSQMPQKKVEQQEIMPGVTGEALLDRSSAQTRAINQLTSATKELKAEITQRASQLQTSAQSLVGQGLFAAPTAAQKALPPAYEPLKGGY